MPNLASSLGWKFISPSGSQRRAPLTASPTPGTSTATSSSRLATKHHDAYFSQAATGTCSASSAATKPRPSAIVWRARKCVGA